MKKNLSPIFPRRDFLMATPALILGGRLFDFPAYLKNQTKKVLPDFLSPEEKKQIASSLMAQEIINQLDKGYSCAESMLKLSLRRMKKNEDLVWAAAGFGGGLYHRDLCGFLTGGVMALGFSAGLLNKTRDEAKAICGESVRQYWSWWLSQAPTHCSEIRTEGTSLHVCRRLGQLAAAKVEGMIPSGRP